MYLNKIIFISALDWGIGHATRCVPLIKELQQHNKIIIGVTPLTSPIFNEEFPEIKKINIEPYNIKYSNYFSVFTILLFNIPRLLSVIKKEKKQLQAIINEHKIDVVISDNRLGLNHAKIESVYITHQLNIKAGVFSFMINKIHHLYMRKFTKIWVPDYKDEQSSLAGNLSHPSGFKNTEYINLLSRLIITDNVTMVYDYLFLLSGPEPQRTLLENTLLKIASSSNAKMCLVRGTTLSLTFPVSKNITVFDLPNSVVLSQLIAKSDVIICRSGYSTLMDLHHLKKTKLILIPTPSQTEQEYLAHYWQQKFGAFCFKQNELSNKLILKPRIEF